MNPRDLSEACALVSVGRFGVCKAELLGRSRARHLELPRRELYRELRRRGWGWEAIARATNRTLGTVYYAARLDDVPPLWVRAIVGRRVGELPRGEAVRRLLREGVGLDHIRIVTGWHSATVRSLAGLRKAPRRERKRLRPPVQRQRVCEAGP